jgi:TPR repeat protein
LIFGIGHKPDSQLSNKYFQIASGKGSSIGLLFSSLFLINKIDDNNSLEQIYRSIEKSAEFDDLNGIIIFGSVCFNGFFKEPNLESFVIHSHQAAEYGSSLPENRFGFSLKIGKGVKKNLSEAVKYFKLSIEHECPTAINNYARCLKNGISCDQNLSEAAKYFKLSANLGNPAAMLNYAICLENGEGITKNLTEAAKYFKLSADLGNPTAMGNYARCLYHGIGCRKSIFEADKYVALAKGNNRFF